MEYQSLLQKKLHDGVFVFTAETTPPDASDKENLLRKIKPLKGVADAIRTASENQGIQVISGIELSTDVPRSEIHLLGYGVSLKDPVFQNKLVNMRESRIDRAREVINKLDSLGVKISWERVQQLSDGGSIGRPHIAKAMVEAGYVKYPRDAFTDYLGRNGLAYVERIKITPIDAIEILVNNGALPVMAHPTFYMDGNGQDDVDKLKYTLVELKEAGLVGMEVYYGNYTVHEVELLENVAKDIGLIPCGGSDYHASGNPDESEPGTVGPPDESLDALLSIKDFSFNNANI